MARTITKTTEDMLARLTPGAARAADGDEFSPIALSVSSGDWMGELLMAELLEQHGATAVRYALVPRMGGDGLLLLVEFAATEAGERGARASRAAALTLDGIHRDEGEQ